MNTAPTVNENASPERTKLALRHAADEIEDAVRPGRPTLRNLLSWAIALGAGGAVIWKSLRAPDPRDATGRNELRLDAATRSALHRAIRKRRPESRSGHQVRPQSDGAPAGQRNDSDAECPTVTAGAGALAKEFFCRFQSVEAMTRSQSLAFIGVLSLGPLLLFALAALGFAIHDTAQVEQFVHDLVGRILPGREASEAANTLIAQTHIIESAHTLMAGKWWAIVVAVLSLVWTAIGLFVGASDAMNASWNARETRGFLALRLAALGVFLVSGVLFLLSIVPSALPSIIGSMNLPFIGSDVKGAWWVEALGWLLAVLINGALFTVIYRILPNANVRWTSALYGGMTAGLLWELAKKGFAVYVVHFGNYNKLYGALAGAVLLVTWIWYSCVLLLAGAILCKMIQEHMRDGGVAATGGSVRAPSATAAATN